MCRPGGNCLHNMDVIIAVLEDFFRLYWTDYAVIGLIFVLAFIMVMCFQSKDK